MSRRWMSWKGSRDRDPTSGDGLGRWSPEAPGYYLRVTASVAATGITALGIYGWTSQGNAWQIFTLGFMVGAAAFWLAGLLGYLFGIPRPLQTGGGPFAANTSLDQISDWLTKIVIGVGLVEIRGLASWVNSIGTNVSRATALPGSQPLFVALILLEAVSGFIFFYIWSRVYMPRLFVLSEVQTEERAREREELAKAREEAARGRTLAEAVRAEVEPPSVEREQPSL